MCPLFDSRLGITGSKLASIPCRGESETLLYDKSFTQNFYSELTLSHLIESRDLRPAKTGYPQNPPGEIFHNYLQSVFVFG